MTGTKNRAFEGEEGESPQRSEVHNPNDPTSFSRKIFPHGVHGPDFSKFVRD